MRHAVHRVALFAGWADAKHGWVTLGTTPVGPVLRADPRARQLLRAHVLRVPRAGPGPELPAAGFPVPPARRPGQPAAGREPPAAVRHPAARVRSRRRRPTDRSVADPFHPSTTRDGWIAQARPTAHAVAASCCNAWRSVLGDSDADTTSTRSTTSSTPTTARSSPTPTRPTPTATGPATPATRRRRARPRRRSSSPGTSPSTRPARPAPPSRTR